MALGSIHPGFRSMELTIKFPCCTIFAQFQRIEIKSFRIGTKVDTVHCPIVVAIWSFLKIVMVRLVFR